MKRLSIIIISIFVFIHGAMALEITDGRVKIKLYENSGRFGFSYLTNATTNEYLPMLLEQDPRTTALSVLVGNKVYIMGDTASFKQKVSQTEDGAEFVWTSSVLEVKEEFSFISSPDSVLSDGIKIILTLTNISGDDLTVGLRYLFDTYLGENDNLHFKTDTISAISNEIEFDSKMPLYWVSPSSKSGTEGLQVMTSGLGVTVPDRIVFANWSRLNDSSWTFSVKTNRNFNNLPYSRNDSAVCHYYNPKEIKKGSSSEIVILLGSFNKNGYSIDQENVSEEVSEIFEQVVTADVTDDKNLSVKNDLESVKDLIDKIDKMIASGEEIDGKELDVMEQILENLQKRKSQY